jgi:hypothetical protein
MCTYARPCIIARACIAASILHEVPLHQRPSESKAHPHTVDSRIIVIKVTIAVGPHQVMAACHVSCRAISYSFLRTVSSLSYVM